MELKSFCFDSAENVKAGFEAMADQPTLCALPTSGKEAYIDFSTLEQFQALEELGVSYVIDYCEGNDEQDQFHLAFQVTHSNLAVWFEALARFEALDSDDERTLVAYFIANHYCPPKDSLRLCIESCFDLDDVYLHHGSGAEYCEQLLADTGGLDDMPDNLRGYFDYESLASDLELNGEITQIGHYLYLIGTQR